MVISAPHSGKVSDLGVRDGDSVDSQDLICKIGKGGDDGGGEEKQEGREGEEDGDEEKKEGEEKKE